MSLLFHSRSDYDLAVLRSADCIIATHGSRADIAAWQAARKPSLTRSERAYCEAVATCVSRRLAGPAPAASR
jgi:hypothetical protein